MTILPKQIGEFIRDNIMGCHFVGFSSDGEVFAEFDHEDEDLELAASRLLQETFPEVKKLVTVVRPSLREVQEMVEALNEALETPSPPKPKLLGIDGF
jgi:hypothetical protein